MICKILNNLLDISNAIERIKEEGRVATKEDIEAIRPNMTSHIKRFGEYVINLDEVLELINKLDIESIMESMTKQNSTN